MLLLPALERSTTENGVKARVVNTSSSGNAYATGNGMLWSVFKDGPERDAKIKEWGPSKAPGSGAQWHLYGHSKIVTIIFLIISEGHPFLTRTQGNIMFTHLLNRYHPAIILSWSVHPGGISTDLQRYFLLRFFLFPHGLTLNLDMPTLLKEK